MSSEEAVILKESGSDPLANNLESLLEKQKATETPLGNVDSGNSHLESSSYHKDTGTGKHHFGNLSLAC